MSSKVSKTINIGVIRQVKAWLCEMDRGRPGQSDTAVRSSDGCPSRRSKREGGSACTTRTRSRSSAGACHMARPSDALCALMPEGLAHASGVLPRCHASSRLPHN